MLKLVKSWLKVPVEGRDDPGRPRRTGGKSSKTGTPQGGVLSPLLANIYMNRFSNALFLVFTKTGQVQAPSGAVRRILIPRV